MKANDARNATRQELIFFLEGVKAGSVPGFTLWNIATDSTITRLRHGKTTIVKPEVLLQQFKPDNHLMVLCDGGIESLNVPAEVKNLIVQYGNVIKFYGNE